jgi:predicted RNA-binding protein (virulence factor B family)
MIISYDTTYMKDPELLVGTFDFYKVISVTDIGAFLECGSAKDLFVPLKEQAQKMKVGESYIVYIYLDERTGRIAGSSKIDKFIDKAKLGLDVNTEVNLLIYDQTSLGYKAIVNNRVGGLIYKTQVFQPLKFGQKLKGYVQKVRLDGKIDLLLQKSGIEDTDKTSKRILDYIKSSGGKANLTDKTPPEVIYKLFGISKKKFKIACGALYKQKLITMDDKGMNYVNKHNQASPRPSRHT